MNNLQLSIDNTDFKKKKVSEEELAVYITEKLSPYFHVYQELLGIYTHWNQTRKVRIDLGLYPKNETINNGFPKLFFGIEIKCFDMDKTWEENTAKFKNALSQCISYKYSKFGKSNIEPAFVLLADNFGVKIKNSQHEDKKQYYRLTNVLFQFAVRQNIGRLIIRDSYVKFRFGNDIWCSLSGFSNQEILYIQPGNRDNAKNPIKPF